MTKTAFFIGLFSPILVFSPIFLFGIQGEDFPSVPKTPVVAHRGFSAVAPENTLSAIREAIDLGAQGCEFDVRRSSDGVLYLMHDGNYKRTAGLDAAAGSLDFAQIRELDAGAWKGPKFLGEKIPSFEEALLLLKGTGTRPVIEIKENGFEKEVVETVRRLELTETAVVIDFSAERVKKIRQLAPEICVAWLCGFKEEVPMDEVGETILQTLKEVGTDTVDIHYGCVTPELLERLQGEGVHVWVWTVDHPADLARMADWGIESITTNRPDLALQAVAEQSAK